MKTLHINLLLLLFTIIFLNSKISAQVPQLINYQAVAHDNSGEPLSLTPITIRVSIYSDTASIANFIELHNRTTNSYGLFHFKIGAGNSSDLLSDLNWESGNHFIKIV